MHVSLLSKKKGCYQLQRVNELAHATKAAANLEFCLITKLCRIFSLFAQRTSHLYKILVFQSYSTFVHKATHVWYNFGPFLDCR
jgi:hypothetical protein